MDLKRSVVSGLSWSLGMRFLGQAVTWGVTLVVIRLLSPADYGLMELAAVFVSFLGMIGELGLGAAVVHRRELREEDLRAIFGLIILVSLLLCLMLSGVAPFIARFYGKEQLTGIIRTLSLLFLLSGLSTVPQSLLMRDLEYRKIAIVSFVSALFGSLTMLALAINDAKVWALVGGALAIRVATLVGTHWARPFLHWPRFAFKGFWSIFVFSGNVTLARILWYMYSFAAASLIIGKVLGAETLGVYGIALFLACLPMEKVSGSLNEVAFPAFSSIQNNPELAGAHFLKATRIISFIAVPIFFGISSVGPEIITIFLGERWVGAIVPMQIIALAVPLRMVRNIMMPALLGLGQAKVNLVNETIAVVLMSGAFYVATLWGLIGVSSVWILVFPLVFVLNLSQTAKALHINPLDIFRGMARSVFAGFLMLISIHLLRDILPVDMNDIMRLLLFVAMGALVYLGITMLINRKGLEEIVGLVKR